MEKEPYLLTIAIPTYNGAKTIGNLLSILIPQIDSRVEILISDNCSTDDTSQIIEKYNYDNLLRYHRNETNIGPDANFLQCMRLATGRFTYLVSDDDIIIEGQIANILNFLENNPKLTLVYLETVGFRNKYTGVNNCIEYNECVERLNETFYTEDKYLFMNYSIRNWGFISSFLWRTEQFKKIESPERFFNTYWLQSYIHIECSKEENALLGVLKGPVVAAGEYSGLNAFNAALVDGVNYKLMIDHAIKCGYNKKQLINFWLWRVCFVARNAIFQERVARKKLTKKGQLFKLLWKYPYAWGKLFPYFFVPRFILVTHYKKNNYKVSENLKRV